jgi:hypothetical protein
MIPSTFGIKKETIIYLAIALVGFLIIVQILRKVGLFSSKEKRAAKAAKAVAKKEKIIKKTQVKSANVSLQNSSGFSLNYFRGKKNLLDDQTAQDYAKTLRKSMRGWGTKETTLMGVFENIKSLAQMSQVSYVYYKIYKRSLKNDILKELNKEEEYNLFLYVAKLPVQ